MSRRTQWWDGDGPIPDERIDHIARELEIGRWLMRAALYGDEPVVEHRFAKVKAAFEAIPGVEVWGTKTTPREAAGIAHPAERIQGGVPDLDMNFMTGWYGGEAAGGHVGFSPVAPMTGRDALSGARPDARPDRGQGQPRLPRRDARDQRAQLHPHHDGDLRHLQRAAGSRPPTTRASCS